MIASVALLKRKDLAVVTGSQDATSEREAQTRDVADVCSAVKSMRKWVTDAESTVTQRFEILDYNNDQLSNTDGRTEALEKTFSGTQVLGHQVSIHPHTLSTLTLS